MAEIISASLNKNSLKSLDDLQKEMNFSGRSETIRAGIRLLLAEHKQLSKLKGTCDAVLLVMHPENKSEKISEIKHKFSSIIKTQIHNHLENHKCLEIFVLHGDATQIRIMTETFQSSKSVELVKLVVA